MEDSDADHRRAETVMDAERDALILKAGCSLAGKIPLEPTYGAIYAGGGVHIGPIHRRKRPHHQSGMTEPLKLKFSFDHALATADVCDVFHALQDILGGGEIDFQLDHGEDWNGTARITCSSEKCKRE